MARFRPEQERGVYARFRQRRRFRRDHHKPNLVAADVRRLHLLRRKYQSLLTSAATPIGLAEGVGGGDRIEHAQRVRGARVAAMKK
jgi:hypothetical protein